MFDLPKVNEARRRKGRPLLTREQATAASASAPADIDLNLFLISLIASSAFDSPGHGVRHESGPGTDSGFTYGDSGGSGSDGGGGGVDSGGG